MPQRHSSEARRPYRHYFTDVDPKSNLTFTVEPVPAGTPVSVNVSLLQWGGVSPVNVVAQPTFNQITFTPSLLAGYKANATNLFFLSVSSPTGANVSYKVTASSSYDIQLLLDNAETLSPELWTANAPSPRRSELLSLLRNGQSGLGRSHHHSLHSRIDGFQQSGVRCVRFQPDGPAKQQHRCMVGLRQRR